MFRYISLIETKQTVNLLKRILPLASAVVVLMLWTISAPHSVRAQPPGKNQGPPPALVQVSPILEREVITKVTLVGTAEPWLETIVASETDGLVREMLVDEGDHVRQGELLCRQDATQIKLRIEAAEAALAESQVQHAQARTEWERQKRLFDKSSVSEKSYDDARFNNMAMEKKVARLQAELLELKDRLNKKNIISPVSGYVVKRHALVGQWLAEGGPVVTINVLNPIRLMVPVPEHYIAHIKVGEESQVTFDGFPNRTFRGLVAALIPKGDELARTFPVRIEVANSDNVIKPGMQGRASLSVGNVHKALLVPKDALVLSSTGDSVFVVNSGSARAVSVKMGAAHGSFFEVQGDLKTGANVVVRGNERLIPGQPVKIVPGTTHYVFPESTKKSGP